MRHPYSIFVSLLILALAITGVTADAGFDTTKLNDGPITKAAADTVLSLDDWFYIHVDDSRSTRSFGLDMRDVTGDGFGDIVSGRYFYRNPGGEMTGTWTRVTITSGEDAVLFLDVDDDNRGDVIAQETEGSNLVFYWLEAGDAQGNSWATVTSIGSVPRASHSTGSQGHRLAQIEAGGKPEIVTTSGNGLYYFEIPASPASGNWPVTHVNSNPTDEGFGVGDIDGDNDLDLAAGTGGSKRVEWYENPGNGSSGWTAYQIGNMNESNWTDRFAIDDLDGDDKPDIVGTEENGQSSGAETYWWEQPADPKSNNWTRHLIVSQATTNSMDTADMDNDGDIDVILAEHQGSEKMAIWENNGSGSFTEHVVDTGEESHLGAQVADLDGDGDKEIVSIAFSAYQHLHLWRNDAATGVPTLLQSFSVAYNDEAKGIELKWYLADVGIDMEFFVSRSDAAGASFREIPHPEIVVDRMKFTFVDKTGEPGHTYRYRVDVTDELGLRTLFETRSIETPVLSLTLDSNYPNPFNPQTTVAYTLPRAGRVTIEVYDASGGWVRTITNEPQTAGAKTATWNGRDSNGEAAASGVYFVRLKFNKEVRTRKITLLK
jgi:hypothetical protein